MMRFAVLTAVALVAPLAGCSSEGAAKDAVKQLLNDPDSAKFSSMRAGMKQGDICGFVNARNRMGGFVGNTPFFYEKNANYAAIISGPTNSDFRMLWLNLQASNKSDDFAQIDTQCRLAGRWMDVCGTTIAQPRHHLCDAMAVGGRALYDGLKAEYGN